MSLVPTIPNFIPRPKAVVGALTPIAVGAVKLRGATNLAFQLPNMLNRLTFGMLGGTPEVKHQPFRETNKSRTWGIATAQTQPNGTISYVGAFTMDSCVHIKFERSATVSMFPVEQGSFAAYNKVISPNTIHIQLAVSNYGNGKDSSRVERLQNQLSDAVAASTLFVVVTPDVIYKNFTIKEFDYPRSADRGQGLVLVDIKLVEVREVSAKYAQVSLPSGTAKVKTAATKKPEGEVQPDDAGYALTGNETLTELDAKASAYVAKKQVPK